MECFAKHLPRQVRLQNLRRLMHQVLNDFGSDTAAYGLGQGLAQQSQKGGWGHDDEPVKLMTPPPPLELIGNF